MYPKQWIRWISSWLLELIMRKQFFCQSKKFYFNLCSNRTAFLSSYENIVFALVRTAFLLFVYI